MTLPVGIFNNLISLVDFGLTDNQLTTLPPNIFEKLTKTPDIALQNNCLPTLQFPVKPILAGYAGSVNKENNPKAGCPQKIITISSLETIRLTGDRKGATDTDTIHLNITIDGVLQGDIGIPDSTIRIGTPLVINKTLYVNSSLQIDALATNAVPNSRDLGQAFLTIDANYQLGNATIQLFGNSSEYFLTLNKQ